ncbi:MAG: type II toxin-antitoxin system RelB/DinJ family antitoxin [Gammaproteobacteria bacterium]|nr:type II toxin-antitoxin system RelB/DinJ family antitoxin [Gammaproteobacteria bacterium]
METKSAFIRARIEPSLKKRAEHIFSALGINTTQVINMLYKYVEREKAVPFDLSIPNA